MSSADINPAELVNLRFERIKKQILDRLNEHHPKPGKARDRVALELLVGAALAIAATDGQDGPLTQRMLWKATMVSVRGAGEL